MATTPALTPEEELLFAVTAMTDETGGPIEMATLADRLGIDSAQADVSPRRLEREGLVRCTRFLGGGTDVSPTPAAFLWRSRQSTDWPTLAADIESWISNAGVSATVESRVLAETVGLHPQAAVGLMEEWERAGRVGPLQLEAGGDVFAQATGL